MPVVTSPALRLRFGRSCARKAKLLAFRLAQGQTASHPSDTASPGLRLRYPQEGGAGPVQLQNVPRSFPVGQEGGIIGQNGSAGISLSKE
jgi:hypothetical protein